MSGHDAVILGGLVAFSSCLVLTGTTVLLAWSSSGRHGQAVTGLSMVFGGIVLGAAVFKVIG